MSVCVFRRPLGKACQWQVATHFCKNKVVLVLTSVRMFRCPLTMARHIFLHKQANSCLC